MIGKIIAFAVLIFLLFLVFSPLIRKAMVGNLVMRGQSPFFFFGLMFIFIFGLNLLSIYLNGYSSIFNHRTPFLIFFSGLLLVLFQRPNYKYLKWLSSIFKILALLNLIIVLGELFFYFTNINILQLIRNLFADSEDAAFILVRNSFLGNVVRPNGLFGGPQIAATLIVLFGSSKLMLSAHRIKIAKRLLLWIMLIVFTILMGSGTPIVIAMAIACTYEYLHSNLRNRRIIVFLFLPFIVFLLFKWNNAIMYQHSYDFSIMDAFNKEKEGSVSFDNSLQGIYLESVNIIPYFKNNNCFIFGCGLDSINFMEHNVDITPELLALHPTASYIGDLGIIVFLNSFGGFYFVAIMAFLIVFYFNARVARETKIILIALAMGDLMTLMHYSITFTGTGFSLMVTNACYILYERWRIQNLYIKKY
jgi:hypothetical protein